MYIKNLIEQIIKEDIYNMNFPPPGWRDGSVYKKSLFHGSDTPNLKTLLPDIGNGEYGIYLTPSHRYARLYGQYLYEVFVNIKNPKFIKHKGTELSPKDITKEDTEKLEQDGFDSIIVTNETQTKIDEVIVFHSDQVWILGQR